MKTQSDEFFNVNLSAFDWYILYEAAFHFVNHPHSRIFERTILTRKARKALRESLVDKISTIRKRVSEYPEIAEEAPHVCEFHQNRELKERFKTVKIEAPFSNSEFDLLFAVVELLMKREGNISGSHELLYVYCWDNALEDLNETYGALKRIMKETRQIPGIDAKEREKENRASRGSVENGATSQSDMIRTFKIDDGLELVFRWIPPGTCRAGADFLAPESFSDEIERTVAFDSGFWMMDSLVTTRMILASNPCFLLSVEWLFDGLRDEEKQIDPEEVLNYPACITWRDATKFCRFLNSRFADSDEIFQVPTEEQWEYAALAGRDYSSANSRDYILQNCWVWENLEKKEEYPYIRSLPHKSEEKEPNPWGLYGMQGNLREWTSTRYRHPILNDVEMFLYRHLRVARSCRYKDYWSCARTSFRMPISYGDAGLRPVIVSRKR